MTRCKTCPIGGPVVEGVGPKNGLMVIGESPSQLEAKKRIPFSGKPSQLLKKTLNRVGVDPADIYWTNAVSCGQEDIDPPKPHVVQACRDRLIEEIRSVQPTKILTTGAIPLAALLGHHIAITKHRGQGQWLEIEGMDPIYLVPTLTPSLVFRAEDFFRDFAWDIQKFIFNTEPEPQPDIDILIASSVKEAITEFDFLMDASTLGVDLETTGFDYWDSIDTIESVGVAAIDPDRPNEGYALIVPFEVADTVGFRKVFRKNLARTDGPRQAFHNLKFDLQFLMSWYGEVLTVGNPMDTMMMSYAQDERSANRGAQGHKLKTLARVRYDIPDYSFDFEKFYDQPYEDRDYQSLFEYHALDCHTTARLAFDLEEELFEESENLLPLVKNHLVPAQITYAEVEWHGTLIDVEYYREYEQELLGEIEPRLFRLQEIAREFGLQIEPIEFDVTDPARINKLLPLIDEDLWDGVFLAHGRAVVLSHLLDQAESFEMDDPKWPFGRTYRSMKGQMSRERNKILKLAEEIGLYKEGKEFNPGSTKDTPALLHALGLHTDGTQKYDLLYGLSVLELEEDHILHQVVDDLIKYRLYTMVLSTFVRGVLKVTDSNNRVHPDYIISGSATGRPACSNPNLQNIPTLLGPAVRKGYIAPEGWTFCQVDYSQLELRIAAHYSGDKRLLEAYMNDEDIHTEFAAAIFKKAPEDITYLERYMAKYVDFGIIYGRGARSLVDGWEMEYYVTEMGGERWSLAEAEEFIENVMKDFPGLAKYIHDQGQLVLKQKYIETPTGRIRRFPFIKYVGGAQRKAVNTPIQSLASDLNMSAMVRIHQRLDPTEAKILFTVYDSIAFEIRDDCIDKVVSIAMEEMQENLPIDSIVPFKADPEVGYNWGALEAYIHESEKIIPG